MDTVYATCGSIGPDQSLGICKSPLQDGASNDWGRNRYRCYGLQPANYLNNLVIEFLRPSRRPTNNWESLEHSLQYSCLRPRLCLAQYRDKTFTGCAEIIRWIDTQIAVLWIEFLVCSIGEVPEITACYTNVAVHDFHDFRTAHPVGIGYIRQG